MYYTLRGRYVNRVNEYGIRQRALFFFFHIFDIRSAIFVSIIICLLLISKLWLFNHMARSMDGQKASKYCGMNIIALWNEKYMKNWWWCGFCCNQWVFFSILLLFKVHFGLVLRILILIQFPFCLYFSCCWSLFQFSSVHFIPLVCYLSVSLYLYIYFYFYVFVLPSFVIWLSYVRCWCFVRPFVSSMPFDEILGKEKQLSWTYWCARITFIFVPFSRFLDSILMCSWRWYFQ